MSVEELTQQGSIHPFEATPGEIKKAMGLARRDLALAEKLLGENFDWCFAIAYNAVLQACRAYMFHSGYRPASAEAHKATFEFMQSVIEEPLKKSISYFDRARTKRHRTLYNDAGLITEKEAEELLRRAKEFLSYVESKVKKR